ncbi:LuxR C-terminal-related transcriptional regulator [Streptomyces sp. HMX87]|uniref:LuxR C-terminal-related transcriptional regulator n=1 Tax=Streptomyces sp. HMX87 TaxID=3390849 RepID=UPI003A8641F2
MPRAREAAARQAWSAAYDVLSALPPDGLTPDDLYLLADAAWWTGHGDEAIAARVRAYSGYAATGADRPAGRAAWMLFYDYRDTGRPGTASGWLHRARQHLDGLPECPEQCYTAWSDAEEAAERGDPDAALAAARRMTAIARAHGDRDLLAMSHQVQAGILLDHGRTAEGLARLDDAMCAVTAGELGALFTGWIYCLALTRCMAAAELGRAVEWTEAALRWCADHSADNPFRGLCRVHRVQVLDLRGDWPGATAEAGRVCAEARPYDTTIAGEAHYLAGDIHRRRGDPAAAETEYARAHALGRGPQPGLALLRLAEGRPGQAATALRLALADAPHAPEGPMGPAGPFGRAQLLAALVEVELAAGNAPAARAAADELELLAPAAGAGQPLLRALADTAHGAVALAGTAPDGHHPPGEARRPLCRALTAWLELGVPYEAARTRMLLAAADRAAGDHEGMVLELRAAHAAFTALGSVPEARRAAALLSRAATPGRTLPAGLSPREAQVLRLVAAGRTNREIAADLCISEHTVARHLNNIFAKLQVSSRAAATAFACAHGLA